MGWVRNAWAARGGLLAGEPPLMPGIGRGYLEVFGLCPCTACVATASSATGHHSAPTCVRVCHALRLEACQFAGGRKAQGYGWS